MLVGRSAERRVEGEATIHTVLKPEILFTFFRIFILTQVSDGSMTCASFARLSLPNTVASLARTIPSLPRTVPSLARTVFNQLGGNSKKVLTIRVREEFQTLDSSV